MEAKLSEISVLARAALSLLEGEASPKTAEAATLVRRVAALAEAAPAQAALPSRPDALLPVEATPARRPEPEDAFKTARATPPPPPKPLRRSPRRSPPKAEPVLQTPSVTFAQPPVEPAPQAAADDQGPARTSNVSDMSLDDEDEEEEPPRRSERIQQRTSSASEASADDVSAPNKENDEPILDSPEERRRAAASFKARRRRRTVDARCLLGDDSPVEKARVVLAAWSDDEQNTNAEDETVEIGVDVEAETVEISANDGTGAAAAAAALAASGATSRYAADWASAVEGAEAAQRVGVQSPPVATKRLAWADHDFSAGGAAKANRAGVAAAVKALVEARDTLVKEFPEDAALLRDALRSGTTAAAAFHARELDAALMGEPGELGERAVALADDLARYEMRRLLNPPRDPISTPAALERAAALRSPRQASPVSLVPDCVAVAESALDRSLAVLVSRALDHCGSAAPPPVTPPSTKGDAFARAVAEADAAVAPHARSLEACAARRFARRFLGDGAVTQAVNASGGWAGVRRAAALLPGSKFALLDDVPALVAALNARSTADDAERRAAKAALMRLQRADAAMLRRVCGVPAKQRVPKPKTLAAHVADAASEALDLDLSYPDFVARAAV